MSDFVSRYELLVLRHKVILYPSAYIVIVQAGRIAAQLSEIIYYNFGLKIFPFLSICDCDLILNDIDTECHVVSQDPVPHFIRGV